LTLAVLVYPAPDLGGDQGDPTMFVFSHMYDMCVPFSHFS